MPRMKTVEFSGYHPQGKKRSLTEAYYMRPSSDSSFAGIELEVQLHDLTKRRRTESGSGVRSGTHYTYSAPPPPHARTVFTPAALKAMDQEVPVAHQPSYDTDLDVLLTKAQDYEIEMRAACDAIQTKLHEANERATSLTSDILDGASRRLNLETRAKEHEANAAEKAKVVEDAGATTLDLRRKLAESRAQADAAEAKKDALLHGLSHESFRHCPPHDDAELTKLLREHEARLKKVERLRARWYWGLRVLKSDWYDAGDVDFVSSALQRLSSSNDLLPPHVLAVLSVEDAKYAQDTGRALAEDLHLRAEARYNEIAEEVGTLTPSLDNRPSTEAYDLAGAEEDLVRISAMISAFNLFRTAETNKRIDAQRACNEHSEAMSYASKCEELLADAEAHEQEALADQQKAEEAKFETWQYFNKVGDEMADFENQLFDPDHDPKAIEEVMAESRQEWEKAVLAVAHIKQHVDSAVLRTACVWP
ncbi:unnamed protein product [Ectocarpus fasciculatus]